MKVSVYNVKAEVVGEKELAPGVFDVTINEGLVHQAAVAQMANERQVLAHTKSRGEVRGGGKKPWKQKGTGRARAGSSRSPLWIGGGVTFGPTKERNFSKKINRQMKKQALTMALTDKARQGALIILDNLNFSPAKTKQAGALLKILAGLSPASGSLRGATAADGKNTSVRQSIVVVGEKTDESALRAMRNLKGVSFIHVQNVNVVELLKHSLLVATVPCVELLEKIYATK